MFRIQGVVCGLDEYSLGSRRCLFSFVFSLSKRLKEKTMGERAKKRRQLELSLPYSPFFLYHDFLV